MAEKITMTAGTLRVPENPEIPFVEGDGTGPDITRAAMTVWNAAVEKAYGVALNAFSPARTSRHAIFLSPP